MRLSSVLCGTLFSGAALLASANAWSMDSKAFITHAIQGNLAEISVGEMAQQKGATDEIKKLGATLVSDHTKANQDAMATAKKLGVTPPDAPTAEQKHMHDMLAGQNGKAFDDHFVDGMLADHKKDAADYQQVADNNKDAAGEYASATLPVIKQHMATMQRLAEDTTMPAKPANAMTAAPVAGANSFTENEARSRIEKAGFSGVGALTKDDQGIWRGMGTKDGQSTPVALDFKGNVSTK